MSSPSPDKISHMLESIATAKTVTPPIDVETLAKSIGLEVIYQNMLCEGSLEIEDDRYIIRVNTKSNQLRQRFTIAHEIGHLIIKKLGREEIFQLIEKGFERNKMTAVITSIDEEKLCDFISAFILVPTSIAKENADWRNFSIEKCQKVARQWQVSISTFLWRVFTVANYDGGFIWYKINNRQIDPNGIELDYFWSVFPKSKKIDIPERVFLRSQNSQRLDYSIIDLRNNEEKFYRRIKFEFKGLSEYRAVRIKPFGKGKEKRVLFVVYPKEIDTRTISMQNVQRTIFGSEFEENGKS